MQPEGESLPNEDVPDEFDSDFDAGVEADEKEDPKKYIQQLCGKLSQSLRNYNNEQPQPDTELNKYVAGMINNAASEGLSPEDVKEIIDKIESGEEGGNVLQPLKDKIDEYKKVYACGPNRMLQAVTNLCIEKNVPIEVSLDEQMGCGVGACLGCIIVLDVDGKKVKKRCCVEGPIFNGKNIDWDALIR